MVMIPLLLVRKTFLLEFLVTILFISIDGDLVILFDVYEGLLCRLFFDNDFLDNRGEILAVKFGKFLSCFLDDEFKFLDS